MFVLIIGLYILITLVVSLILARFNSKLYILLENAPSFQKKYNGVELIGLSFLWPLFPLFFIIVGWGILINKISK